MTRPHLLTANITRLVPRPARWLATLSLAWVGAMASFPLQAATPAPDMPLPPCTEQDGQQQGACPNLSDEVTASAGGRFAAGGTVLITTDPTNPVCDHHNGYPPYPWSPSPCYSAVSAPNIAGCAVIDLQDGARFREISCQQALYKDPQDVPSPMFTTTGPTGTTRCSAAGNYGTYVYGGPANVEGARWAEFGPDYLECQLTFNGTRPDGLYGPTWVKINVGVTLAQDGDERRGMRGASAQIYVPIDGDLREDTADVSVLATSTLDESDGALNATFTASISNDGPADAESFNMTIILPKHAHYLAVSDGRCAPETSSEGVINMEPTGGSLHCNDLTLSAGDTEFIDVEARITNAADIGEAQVERPATFTLSGLDNDIDTSDNEDRTYVFPTLRSGSVAETREAMRVLDAYFDYETDMLDSQCNVYMDDIWTRLNAIRAQNPSAFENLAFGKVTSGDYSWLPIAGENLITRAGHVGVVVYPKGTDYHQTGIVIHGTPTNSPADRDDETQVGAANVGDHSGTSLRSGTAAHGNYYRTPVQNFPGSARPEPSDLCGFEGVYSDNVDTFDRYQPDACAVLSTATPDPAALSCPFAPDAVVIRTQSPVEILATNTTGQRVETEDGIIAVEEIDGGIHSFAEPHADGTFGWTLVLPPDDYDVQLLGTGSGPYTLTMTTFDDNGEPVDVVTEGTIEPGQVDDNTVSAPPAAPTPGGTGSGGGGGLGVLLLIALMSLTTIRRAIYREKTPTLRGHAARSTS